MQVLKYYKEKKSMSPSQILDIRSHSFHSFSDKSLMHMHHLQLTSKSNLPIVFTESPQKLLFSIWLFGYFLVHQYYFMTLNFVSLSILETSTLVLIVEM